MVFSRTRSRISRLLFISASLMILYDGERPCCVVYYRCFVCLWLDALYSCLLSCIQDQSLYSQRSVALQSDSLYKITTVRVDLQDIWEVVCSNVAVTYTDIKTDFDKTSGVEKSLLTDGKHWFPFDAIVWSSFLRLFGCCFSGLCSQGRWVL